MEPISPRVAKQPDPAPVPAAPSRITSFFQSLFTVPYNVVVAGVSNGVSAVAHRVEKSYESSDQEYLRRLVGDDSLYHLLCQFSPPNDFVRGFIVRLVSSYCKEIYKDKTGLSKDQVITDIILYLDEKVSNIFIKADQCREDPKSVQLLFLTQTDELLDKLSGGILQDPKFYEITKHIVSSATGKLIELPTVKDVVMTLLPRFMKNTAQIDPHEDGAISKVIKEGLAKFLYELWLANRKAQTIKSDDPLLKATSGITNVWVRKNLANLIPDNPIKNILKEILPHTRSFNGVLDFVEKYIPNFVESVYDDLFKKIKATSHRDFLVKLSGDLREFFRANKDNKEIGNHFVDRYLSGLKESKLIPKTFRDLAVKTISKYLNDQLLTKSALIENYIEALCKETEIFVNDPLVAFSRDARNKTDGLAAQFTPNFLNQVPDRFKNCVDIPAAEKLVSEAFYHAFARFKLELEKEDPDHPIRSFDVLQSKIIERAHQEIQRLLALGNGAIPQTFGPGTFTELAQDLLSKIAPSLNHIPMIKGEFSKILFYLYLILAHEEKAPKGEIFSTSVDAELTPFLKEVVSKILDKALEDKIALTSNLFLTPEQLCNPRTLEVAKKALFNHLITGFKSLFKNGDDSELFEGFKGWIGWNVRRALNLSEAGIKKEEAKLFSRVPAKYHVYLQEWLSKVVRSRAEYAAVIYELNYKSRYRDILPLLEKKDLLNNGFESGAKQLFSLFRRYGEEKGLIFNRFKSWVSQYAFDPVKVPPISNVDASFETKAFLHKFPRDLRDYAYDLLTYYSKDNTGALARHLNHKLNFDEKAFLEFLKSAQLLDKNVGTNFLRLLTPKLCEFPRFIDNFTDLLPEVVFRLLGPLAEKIAAKGEVDELSLELSSPKGGAELAIILKSNKAIIGGIQRSIHLALRPNDKHLKEITNPIIGPNMAQLLVEKATLHLLKNYSRYSEGDLLSSLVENLSQTNIFIANKADLTIYAKALINNLCPVFEAFENNGIEAVVDMLQAVQRKFSVPAAKNYLDDIELLLLDKGKGLDTTRDVKDTLFKVAHQLSKIIIRSAKGSAIKNFDKVFHKAIRSNNPITVHAENVLTTQILKGIRNLIRKVEVENPGSKETLVTRILSYTLEKMSMALVDTKEDNFKELTVAIFDLLGIQEDLNIDLSELKTDILPKLFMQYHHILTRLIDEISANNKRLQEKYPKVPEFCRILGTVWLKEFIPHHLSTESAKLAPKLVNILNQFFETTVLDKNAEGLLSSSLKALALASSNDRLRGFYRFLGRYVQGFMVRFLADFLTGIEPKGLSELIGRMMIQNSSVYFQEVKKAKGKLPYAYLLTESDLQAKLGALYSKGMPLGKEELTIDQQAFYSDLSERICLRGGFSDPETLPMMDFVQESMHDSIIDTVIPNILYSSLSNATSKKTLNLALLGFIDQMRESLSKDWLEEEEKYEAVLNILIDLNYRLQKAPEVYQLKKLINQAKHNYGADSEQINPILNLVISSVHDGFTVEELRLLVTKIQRSTNAMADEYNSIVNDEDFLKQLSLLRDGILEMAPREVIAPLLNISSYDEMSQLQFAVLYKRLMREQTFEKWVDNGVNALLTSMIPSGRFNGNRFEPIGKEFSVDLTQMPYSDRLASEHHKKIVNGLAAISVDGTIKAILFKIRMFFRDLRLKIGNILINICGHRIIKIRDFFNMIYFFVVEKCLIPTMSVLFFFPGLLIKYCMRLIARSEMEPHVRGVHKPHTHNLILNSFRDLVTLLTDEKIQNSQLRMSN